MCAGNILAKNAVVYSSVTVIVENLKCPIVFQVYVDNEPTKKSSACLFTVHSIGVENHESKEDNASRPVTGVAREKMGIVAILARLHYLKKNIFFFLVHRIKELGPLGVFEENVRNANEDLLAARNFSEVPSVDVIKMIRYEYDKKYKLDEDVFKEVRILREDMSSFDVSSKNIKGIHS